MFVVIGLMLGGICIGYLFRKYDWKWIGSMITMLIWGLLFLLGVEVGGNRQIMEGLGTLGVEAVVITLFAVIGSCMAAWLLWFFLYKKKGTTV